MKRKSRTTVAQKAFLVGFGLFLLLGLELACRLAGFGGTPPLVLPFLDEPERWVEVNPQVAAPFFARRAPDGSETVGAHRRELLRQPKDEDSLRVLFLGASSVEGFPLPRNLTAARFLERMLDEATPHHDVQVVNLGITAIASFPVRVLGERAMAELDPDLVLVYAGHNELFGASGVASHQFLGRTPRAMRWMVRLRSTGVGGALQDLLRPPPEDPGEQRRNLIEMMAGVERVEPGGKLHRAALASLEANLAALVEAAQRRGTPIVLSTLVSLERGLHPIASWVEDEAGREVLEADIQASRSGLEREPERVLREVEMRLAEEPRNAASIYLRAEALERLERHEEAAASYRRARDLDAMPWRAPADRNLLIRELAKQYGVPLSDAAGVFEAEAGGATDWELFYDHVHPSLRGQELLARSLYQTIQAEGLLPAGVLESRTLPKWHATARQLGAHPLEGYIALHKMKTLFETPPMSHANRATAERIDRVLAGQRTTWDAVDQRAFAIWERLSLRAGFTVPISYPASRAALLLGERRWARTYARAAIANAYPWSDQRANARLAAVESWLVGSAPIEEAGFEAALAAAQDEVRTVRRTAIPPSALLAAVDARLQLLAGVDEERLWDEAERLAAEAPAWVVPYLELLPSREVYRHWRTRIQSQP